MQWAEILLVIVVGFVVFNVGGTLLETIQGKFGIETKAELKQKTIEQSKALEQITNINKDLVKNNEDLIKSKDINRDVVINQIKEEIKIENNFQKIKYKKEVSIEKIVDSFSKEPITVENTKEMEKQISTQQISALWEMYCSSSDNLKQCEVNHV